MGIHESQSLFFEMQIGRSDAFIAHLAHMAGNHFNDPEFEQENFKKIYTIINVGDLNGFDDGATVDLAAVVSAGLVSKEKSELFKVLGTGELTKKLTVRVDALSKSAQEKIENAGGTVEMIPAKQHRPKFVKKGQTTPSPKKGAAPAAEAAAPAPEAPEAPEGEGSE